jgi:hypothetical protein
MILRQIKRRIPGNPRKPINKADIMFKAIWNSKMPPKIRLNKNITVPPTITLYMDFIINFKRAIKSPQFLDNFIIIILNST